MSNRYEACQFCNESVLVYATGEYPYFLLFGKPICYNCRKKALKDLKTEMTT